MAGEGEEKPGRGFTVVDRRASASKEGPAEGEGAEPGGNLPGVDFTTFVISLGSSALFHMGLVDDPETAKPAEPNLVLARQTIDTLEMLEAKTRGNLDEEEARLMESLLYELRMRFVEAGK